MEQVHKFKYLGCMVKCRGTEKVVCEKVMNGITIAGDIKALVNRKRLSLECAIVLHNLFTQTLMYENETIVWKRE